MTRSEFILIVLEGMRPFSAELCHGDFPFGKISRWESGFKPGVWIFQWVPRGGLVRNLEFPTISKLVDMLIEQNFQYMDKPLITEDNQEK